ncbi:hypothetical protein CHS0354_027509 [Potamilus streckersoni]|uniref:Uncharacterized protein n=1 Tax=Potamilus streckersoni TaxID=2493646 RepID=A0AAE0S4T3_9BIVA|nr:hypothetical protein CHS0354_027509 [Potamilus streckersoni]
MWQSSDRRQLYWVLTLGPYPRSDELSRQHNHRKRNPMVRVNTTIGRGTPWSVSTQPSEEELDGPCQHNHRKRNFMVRVNITIGRGTSWSGQHNQGRGTPWSVSTQPRKREYISL